MNFIILPYDPQSMATFKKQVEDNQSGTIAGFPTAMSANIDTDTSYGKHYDFFQGNNWFGIDARWIIEKKAYTTGSTTDFAKVFKDDKQNTLTTQNKVIYTFKFTK